MARFWRHVDILLLSTHECATTGIGLVRALSNHPAVSLEVPQDTLSLMHRVLLAGHQTTLVLGTYANLLCTPCNREPFLTSGGLKALEVLLETGLETGGDSVPDGSVLLGTTRCLLLLVACSDPGVRETARASPVPALCAGALQRGGAAALWLDELDRCRAHGGDGGALGGGQAMHAARLERGQEQWARRTPEQSSEHECVLCSLPLAVGAAGFQGPNCVHPLHLQCARLWLEATRACPTCRADLVGTGALEG
jgi:hypothetical protein